MTVEDWVLIGERDPERRYRRVHVTPELLASIIGTGGVVAVEEVMDLRIVAIRASSWRRVIEFMVSSSTFEPVPLAEIEPEWTQSYRRIEAFRERMAQGG